MESTDISVPSGRTISTEKRWILFVFAPFVWLAYMVFAIVFEDARGLSRVIDLVAGIALNILTFAWCRLDSEECGYHLHRLFPIATILFGFLALLYYLFRSRGAGGGLIGTGWFFLYGLCCVVAGTTAAIVILAGLAITGVVSPDIFSE